MGRERERGESPCQATPSPGGVAPTLLASGCRCGRSGVFAGKQPPCFLSLVRLGDRVVHGFSPGVSFLPLGSQRRRSSSESPCRCRCCRHRYGTSLSFGNHSSSPEEQQALVEGRNAPAPEPLVASGVALPHSLETVVTGLSPPSSGRNRGIDPGPSPDCLGRCESWRTEASEKPDPGHTSPAWPFTV